MGKSFLVAAGMLLMTAFSSLCSAQTSIFEPTRWGVTAADFDPEALYRQMDLDGVIDFDLFKRGVEGYNQLNPTRKDVLTLVDFTKSSGEERCYVLDLQNKKLLYKSFVAHGRNSGQEFATSFSNKYGSFKSSPGFYRTANTYKGRNGYSLVLDGLEEGINDNARHRAIVVHGSRYVNAQIANSRGQVGRSLGCPALPSDISKKVIDAIKGGSLFYIHSNQNEYLTRSAIKDNEPLCYPLANIETNNEWWFSKFPSVDLAWFA